MTNSKGRKKARAQAHVNLLAQKDARIAELEAKLKFYEHDSLRSSSNTCSNSSPKIAALESKIESLTARLENVERSRSEVADCLRRIKSTIECNFGSRAVRRFTDNNLTAVLKRRCEDAIKLNPEGLPFQGSAGANASSSPTLESQGAGKLEESSLTIDSVTAYAMNWKIERATINNSTPIKRESQSQNNHRNASFDISRINVSTPDTTHTRHRVGFRNERHKADD